MGEPPHRPDSFECLDCGGPLEARVGAIWDRRFGAPGAYNAAVCRRCGLWQTVPRPDPKALNALYEAYYNLGGQAAPGYARARSAVTNSRAYRLWLALDGDMTFALRRGAGRLLDIGCNEGRGLATYRANGFDAVGVEPNAVAAARAREGGFEVYDGEVSDLPLAPPFDVAVMSNVLEHALAPRATLEALHARLTPGGEVWISLPNVESWQRRLFGRAWTGWHMPFHITHFSIATLMRLLGTCGFAPIECRQVSPALWFAQSTIAAVFGRRGAPNRAMQKTALLAALMLAARFGLFPVLWLANRMGGGDTLIVRARRL